MMIEKCRKYASRVPLFPLVRAWVKYHRYGTGHAYLCHRCGFWHYTKQNRGGFFKASPSGYRARARRRVA